MWIKFGIIRLYRLEDFNVLVLEKDAEIFLKTHYERWNSVSKPTQMENIPTIKWFKTNIYTVYIGEKKSFNRLIVSAKLFWNIKKQWKK